MMETTFYKRLCMTLTMLLVIFTGLITIAVDAHASHSHKRVAVVSPGPAPVKVVARLPAGHHSVRVGRQPYSYHRGVFYRKGPSGFVVVRAPIGAVVVNLPLGYRHWVLGGITYYSSGNVYYRAVPAGYEVIEPPVRTSPAFAQGEQVWVSIPVLNVRSGPGLDYQIVRQVNQGDVLFVRENGPGWLYVELPDGQFGWVMRQFTAPQLVQAGG